jgi:hypothetical protein
MEELRVQVLDEAVLVVENDGQKALMDGPGGFDACHLRFETDPGC